MAGNNNSVDEGRPAASGRTGLMLGLAVLLALSIGIRFYKLGVTDTRSDEVELVEQLQGGVKPVEYFKWFIEVFQAGRQMPLSRVATCIYMRTFELPVTLFHVRTPFAMLSALTPLFLVFLGRWWAGPRLGWILGVLGLVNPFALFWGRIGLAYGFVLPFVVLTAAFFVPLLNNAAGGRPLPRGLLAGVTAAAVLGSYSHLSAWPFTGLLWLALFFLVLKKAAWNFRAVPARCWIAFAVWALSIAPWAYSFLTAVNTKWDILDKISNDPVYTFAAMRRLPFVMGWGRGVPGVFLTLGLPLLGLVLAWKNRGLRPGLALTLLIGVVLFAMLALMMTLSGGIYTLRYFTPLWIIPILLAGLAIHEAAAWVGRRWPRPGAATLSAALFLAGVAAHAAAPLWWTVNLTGHPTPYSHVSRWLDAHLPKGAPAIVDRWFEPSHEMRFHAPTNTYVTFTVPNEPLKNFLELKWRDTVKQFALRYPDAAYVELIKCYFYVPTVGGWEWPRQYFARHAVITNEPALKLRQRWLGMTEDYYADNTNRIVCEIFYNTTEDMLEKARAAGQPFFLQYGEGWRYAKTQDFRDWRMLEGAAEVELFNLTGAPQEARLTVRGAAVEGTKQVRSSTGAQETFPANQRHEWAVVLTSLPPGRTVVRLTDSLGPAAHAVLLVEDLRLAADQGASITR
ncbi:MAG TPA: hypothetical protein P5567_12440 [Kiritimatiellia bacterium]|nr:hypothetical protein [Kiritimatiellia bacterium]HRZ13250.1 hypothetical protein [Kiritimatiellia bacterium]HSA18699.1 hypothetical protein [Kiritimatiellia bacterium]